MAIVNTRLRAVSSKDLEDLLAWVNGLGFKIEIKGGPILKGAEWHLFYILPEEENPALKNIPFHLKL